MTLLKHAKSRIDVDPPFGHPGATSGAGTADSGCLGRVKDCGATPDSRRSAPGLDRPGPGTDADELEPLDSSCKRSGRRRLEAASQARAPIAVDACFEQSFGEGLGEVTPILRAESRPVGRADAGDLLEASMGNKSEGPTGPILDASVGLPAEAGQLQLSASQRRRSSQVSAHPKKNFGAWVGVRRWSFRTRRGSACIPAWDEVGRNAANGCGLRPRVAIMRGSIFPGGWHPCWGGAA
jgi:hypothetical protein